MASGSTLTNLTEYESLIESVGSISSVIAFLAFGAVCFIIGRQVLPQVSPVQYEAQKAKIKSLKHRIASLEDKLAQKDEDKAEDDGRFQDMPDEDVKKMKKTLQSQKRELRSASEKINLLSAQNDHIRSEWQKVKTELAVAKDELRGARVYMSMEDEYSGAEVVKYVERLNAAILQAAANLAERLDIETMVEHESGLDNPNEGVMQRAEDIIGVHLLKLLQSSRNQVVLELAFQTAMVLYAHRLASSWCFRSLKEEELLQESYMCMRENSEFRILEGVHKILILRFGQELQGIFGRWRQLTRTHLRPGKSAMEPQLLPNLAEELVDVVIAAGHREDPSSVRKNIMTSFAETLGEIVDLAKGLNGMMGEGVTSADIGLIFVKPDTTYDPAEMAEADGSTMGDIREQIVCTTDLGLVGVKKTANSIESFVMLKAKVILPSMLAGLEDT